MSSKELQSELFFISRNTDSTAPTIIFLHGLCSCHLEFFHVIPNLQKEYHIIAVDLPKHSQSKSIAVTEPFTLSLAATCVYSIIRNHAHNGRAHVVGLSLGGFVALKLAEEYPGIVDSVWVTGSSPPQGLIKWFSERPSLVYYGIAKPVDSVPFWLYNAVTSWQGMKPHRELRNEMATNASAALFREVYSSILDFTDADVREIGRKGIQVLTVAAEVHDDIKATRKMGQTLRQGGSAESRAVVIKKAVHSWDLQFPELFAAGIRAWINGADLPKEYEILS